MSWPADKVSRVSTDSLIPFARNARTHSDEQVAQIAASITEWGWTTPILVDEQSNVIAGHGRLLAARKLGMQDVPVVVAEGWSDAKRRAYVLADNKLALNAGWDDAMMALEMASLQADEFDLSLLGFSEDELVGLLEGAPDFAPGSEEDQGKLDELAPKMVTCPHCGEEFDSREQG